MQQNTIAMYIQKKCAQNDITQPTLHQSREGAPSTKAQSCMFPSALPHFPRNQSFIKPRSSSFLSPVCRRTIVRSYVGRDVQVVLVSLFGQPIVWSISHFLGQPKKLVQSQRLDNFFVHSLEFVCPVFLENWLPSNQRVDKKNCPWLQSLIERFVFRRLKFCKAMKSSPLYRWMILKLEKIKFR